MSVSEWVDYQACPQEIRHLRLGSGPCRLCAQPAPADRALTSAGKFHWLCWQSQLDWSDRYRPGRMLDLTAEDFVAWAAAHPAQHRQYVSFLASSAAFAPDDFLRPTRGYLLTPGQPPTTVILHRDGTVERTKQPQSARWGCDPAGLLVLYLDRAQYRIVGQRSGLHIGRRVAHGSASGEPVFLGLWSDSPTGTAVRVAGRTCTGLRGGPGSEYAEQDLFRETGERVSVLGPESRVRLDPDVSRRRLTYRRGVRRIVLDGGPVYRGAGDYADWRLTFLRPLGAPA